MGVRGPVVTLAAVAALGAGILAVNVVAFHAPDAPAVERAVAPAPAPTAPGAAPPAPVEGVPVGAPPTAGHGGSHYGY